MAHLDMYNITSFEDSWRFVKEVEHLQWTKIIIGYSTESAVVVGIKQTWVDREYCAYSLQCIFLQCSDSGSKCSHAGRTAAAADRERGSGSTVWYVEHVITLKAYSG